MENNLEFLNKVVSHIKLKITTNRHVLTSKNAKIVQEYLVLIQIIKEIVGHNLSIKFGKLNNMVLLKEYKK
jgi:hypothetical protein